MDLSKFFSLRVLHDGPMRGFGVARSVERTTGGCCFPTEGTIYPALRKFEAGGFVTATEEVARGRQRRFHELTDADRARAKRAAFFARTPRSSMRQGTAP